MLEVMKEFLLFGVIEVAILLMLYRYVGKIKTIKWWHFIPICPFYFIIGLSTTPFAKQIGMVIIGISYLFFINNVKVLNGIKLV